MNKCTARSVARVTEDTRADAARKKNTESNFIRRYNEIFFSPSSATIAYAQLIQYNPASNSEDKSRNRNTRAYCYYNTKCNTKIFDRKSCLLPGKHQFAKSILLPGCFFPSLTKVVRRFTRMRKKSLLNFMRKTSFFRHPSSDRLTLHQHWCCKHSLYSSVATRDYHSC